MYFKLFTNLKEVSCTEYHINAFSWIFQDIRKHLRDSRPESIGSSEDYVSYEDETGASGDFSQLLGGNPFLGHSDDDGSSRTENSDVFESEPGYEGIYDAGDLDVDYENNASNSSEHSSEDKHYEGQNSPIDPDYEDGHQNGEDNSNVDGQEEGEVIIIGTDYDVGKSYIFEHIYSWAVFYAWKNIQYLFL